MTPTKKQEINYRTISGVIHAFDLALLTDRLQPQRHSGMNVVFLNEHVASWRRTLSFFIQKNSADSPLCKTTVLLRGRGRGGEEDLLVH